jgi:hypothetical protein
MAKYKIQLNDKSYYIYADSQEHAVKKLRDAQAKRISDMALSRADAMDRCISLGKRFIEHFDKVYKEPNSQARGHWSGEMQGWLNSVRQIKLKTTNDAILDGDLRDWFFTAGANPQDFMTSPTSEELKVYDKFTTSVINGNSVVSALNSVGIKDELIQSGSEEAFKKNIATEIEAGKDPKQAAAIAYSVQRENDNKVVDTDLVEGKTYISNKGNKLKVKKVVFGYSDYNGEPYVNIYYDFETIDGKKGSSKCNTNDFFKMLKDSAIQDDWSKGISVTVNVDTESLIQAAKNKKVRIGNGDTPEKFIGKTSLKFRLPNGDDTAYLNMQNNNSVVKYNLYDDEFTYKEFGGKSDFTKAKLTTNLKKLQEYVVNQLKSAGIKVFQSKVEIGGSSKFNSVWRQAQAYNDSSIKDKSIADAKLVIPMRTARENLPDIDEDLHWYNTRYGSLNFNKNDSYLTIEGSQSDLDKFVKQYHLNDSHINWAVNDSNISEPKNWIYVMYGSDNREYKVENLTKSEAEHLLKNNKLLGFNGIVFENKSVKDSVTYGITTATKWRKGNKKPERICYSLEDARYNKNSLERADRIDYVIFEIETGKEVY